MSAPGGIRRAWGTRPGAFPHGCIFACGLLASGLVVGTRDFPQAMCPECSWLLTRKERVSPPLGPFSEPLVGAQWATAFN